MIWFMVMQVVSTLIELVRLGRQSESDKDLEILLLRRQLAIYERRQKQTPLIAERETNVGGAGNEVENQDRTHDQSHGRGDSDRKTGVS